MVSINSLTNRDYFLLKNAIVLFNYEFWKQLDIYVWMNDHLSGGELESIYKSIKLYLTKWSYLLQEMRKNKGYCLKY